MESGCQCSRAAGKILVAFHYRTANTVSQGQLLAQQVNVKKTLQGPKGHNLPLFVLSTWPTDLTQLTQ